MKLHQNTISSLTSSHPRCSFLSSQHRTPTTHCSWDSILKWISYHFRIIYFCRAPSDHFLILFQSTAPQIALTTLMGKGRRTAAGRQQPLRAPFTSKGTKQRGLKGSNCRTICPPRSHSRGKKPSTPSLQKLSKLEAERSQCKYSSCPERIQPHEANHKRKYDFSWDVPIPPPIPPPQACVSQKETTCESSWGQMGDIPLLKAAQRAGKREDLQALSLGGSEPRSACRITDWWYWQLQMTAHLWLKQGFSPSCHGGRAPGLPWPPQHSDLTLPRTAPKEVMCTVPVKHMNTATL